MLGGAGWWVLFVLALLLVAKRSVGATRQCATVPGGKTASRNKS